MLLWTVMPEEVVLDGIDQARSFQEVTYQGKKLIVEAGQNRKAVIIQLLSTDPEDFLHGQFSPGREIE